ncbi:MAG: SEC-C domain-containing protein [Kofleriaceae bacterium]|nr:SEC-C domain-containing protein [Kofleriaceae bacterium]MCB9572702.1 SEC-C domain-containing protein [Kofleriaceae bacterium]
MSRLDETLQALTDAAAGRRALPVVRPVDAEAACHRFHAQIDRGTAVRADAVAAAGRTIACGAGCDACCASVPRVLAAEAVTIARWLAAPDHADARAGFEAAYPTWRARLGDLLDAAAAATAAGDVAAARDALAAAWRRDVKCAFDRDGACTIYPVRPAVCRDAHALDTAARCQPGATEPVATWRFEPLARYLDDLRPVEAALDLALCPDDGGPRPLCDAVDAQLRAATAAAAPPGRNDPCPCGSGKKYKRCHGAG